MNIAGKNIKNEIILIVVSLIVLVGLSVVYFYVKNGKSDLKTFTPEEKMNILNSLTASSTNNMSVEEKSKTLEKVNSSPKTSSLSETEKEKILNSLSR